MTTRTEIEQQIDREVGEWQHKVYDADISPLFIPAFRKAILAVSPAQHNLPAVYLKKVASKRVDELTRADVGLMINMIAIAPLRSLSEDLETALDELDRVGTLRDRYNKEAKEKSDVMLKKFKTLMQLNGIIMDKSATPYTPKIEQL